jgi:transcriptional regulator with XRE-family HTH domain
MTKVGIMSMAAIDQVSWAADMQDEKYFKALGARLAEARRAARLTQVELAAQLDIPQQTLARYETGESRPPILVLIAMSQALGFSLDDMLTGRAEGRSKRGPASRLEQQLNAIARLPKAKQRIVADMLDGILQGS